MIIYDAEFIPCPVISRPCFSRVMGVLRSALLLHVPCESLSFRLCSAVIYATLLSVLHASLSLVLGGSVLFQNIVRVRRVRDVRHVRHDAITSLWRGYDYYTLLRLRYYATTTILCHNYYTLLRLLYYATTTILCYDYYTLLRLLYSATTTALCYDNCTLLRLLYYVTTTIFCYRYCTMLRLLYYAESETGILCLLHYAGGLWVRPALRRAGCAFF